MDFTLHFNVWLKTNPIRKLVGWNFRIGAIKKEKKNFRKVLNFIKGVKKVFINKSLVLD